MILALIIALIFCIGVLFGAGMAVVMLALSGAQSAANYGDD